MDETTAPELSHPELPRWSWSAADLFLFFGFFCVSFVVLTTASVQIARIFRPGISLTDLSGELQILIQVVLNFVWVGFIFFLIKVVHHQPIRESLHWIPTSRYRKIGSIALGVLMSIAVSLASSLFLPTTPLPIEKLAESTRSLIFLAVFGMFLAPIMEEIMFRGFFFTAMCDLTSPRVAVPVTALLFALLHAPQLWGSWPAVGLIFVLGYVLSLARYRSNSLVPSFIIHTAYNSTLFGVSVIGALLERGK